jgi:hypothetical protein
LLTTPLPSNPSPHLVLWDGLPLGVNELVKELVSEAQRMVQLVNKHSSSGVRILLQRSMAQVGSAQQGAVGSWVKEAGQRPGCCTAAAGFIVEGGYIEVVVRCLASTTCMVATGTSRYCTPVAECSSFRSKASGSTQGAKHHLHHHALLLAFH